MEMDAVVNTFMASIENPVLSTVSEMIALIFDPAVLIVFSLFVAPYIYMKSSKRKGVLFGGIVVISGVIILILKNVFERARPLNSLLPEVSFSLPSGHATMAVVFFGLLVYLFVSRKYKVWASIFAGVIVFIIGLSRVYLRVHWLTDVLAGFVLGALILGASILMFRRSS